MLRRRIDEIYEETGSKARMNGKMPGKFYATMTLRQSCLLSPTLFSTSTADLEKKTEKRTSSRNSNRERKDIVMVYVGDIILLTKNT